MSANSVLPPIGFTTRAESREYLAGIARNELSECQSMLPRLNRRWREARSSGRPSRPRLDTSFMPDLEALVLGLGDVAAAGILQGAEVPAERHLLLVGDRLVVEDEHGVAVHARLDRRHLFARRAVWRCRCRTPRPRTRGGSGGWPRSSGWLLGKDWASLSRRPRRPVHVASPITAMAWISISIPGRAKVVTVMRRAGRVAPPGNFSLRISTKRSP